MRKIVLIAALFAMFVPVFAYAANDYPLVSANRLAVGAGVNREWTPNADASAIRQEFTAGVYAAYALTASQSEQRIPRLSLVGSSIYGFDSKASRWSLGVRVTLWDGGK